MRYLILVLVMIALCVTSAFAAATEMIGPRGTVDVTVPAAQYLNVFTAGTANVYKEVGGPSAGTARKFVLETSGGMSQQEVVFGPYTNATVVRIEAGANGASYSVGALAVALACEVFLPAIPVRAQLAPATCTTTATLTSAKLMSGIITADNSSGGTFTYTLPTGTLLDTATGLSIGQGFEWTIINISTAAADVLTVAAGATHTIVGVATVASAHASTGGLYGSSAKFFTRKTAANTFITYRMN